MLFQNIRVKHIQKFQAHNKAKKVKTTIQRNHIVKVIAGKYKGTIGYIVRKMGLLCFISSLGRKAVVRNKETISYPKIHISNVMHYNPASKTRSRVYVQYIDKRKKYFYKNDQTEIAIHAPEAKQKTS